MPMKLTDLSLDLGQLTRRVDVQRLVETADAYGQLAQTWETVGTYWAYVQPLPMRSHEVESARQLRALLSHAVVMRWNPDLVLDPTCRLAEGSRVLNVHSVINIEERNVKLVAYCTEQVKP